MSPTTKRGAVLVLFVYFVMAMMLLMDLQIRWMAGVSKAQRMDLASRNIVMSVLRVQAHALEALAKDAAEIARLSKTADSSGVMMDRSNWSKVREKGDKLKTSLSGHKGRLTAVRRVVAEANGVLPEDVTIRSPLTPAMGVEILGQFVRDEGGAVGWMPSFWVRRMWDPDRRASRHLPVAQALVRWNDARVGELERRVNGRIVWEGQHDDPFVQQRENGGIPRNWSEAVFQNQADPYRWPYFSARSDR